MTVGDLIKLLQQYDHNTPVLIKDIEENEYDPDPELRYQESWVADELVEDGGAPTVYL